MHNHDGSVSVMKPVVRDEGDRDTANACNHKQVIDSFPFDSEDCLEHSTSVTHGDGSQVNVREEIEDHNEITTKQTNEKQRVLLGDEMDDGSVQEEPQSAKLTAKQNKELLDSEDEDRSQFWECKSKEFLKNSDLFDAEESDNDEITDHAHSKSPEENEHTETIGDTVNFDDVDEKKKNKKTKKEKQPKKGKLEKTEKTLKTVKKQKDELLQLHSESQRLLRESKVHLPYHVPVQKPLSYFLNRKKNSVVPQKIKLTDAEIRKLLLSKQQDDVEIKETCNGQSVKNGKRQFNESELVELKLELDSGVHPDELTERLKRLDKREPVDASPIVVSADDDLADNTEIGDNDNSNCDETKMDDGRSELCNGRSEMCDGRDGGSEERFYLEPDSIEMNEDDQLDFNVNRNLNSLIGDSRKSGLKDSPKNQNDSLNYQRDSLKDQNDTPKDSRDQSTRLSKSSLLSKMGGDQLFMKLQSLTPKLSGDPNSIIDFNDNNQDDGPLSGAELLYNRLIKHVTPPLKEESQKRKVELSIIKKEVDPHTGAENLIRDVIHVNTDDDVNNNPSPAGTSTMSRDVLKEVLKARIREKRIEAWKKRLEAYELDNEKGGKWTSSNDDDLHKELPVDEEEEEDLTESEGEEEDDVLLEDKKRVRNEFVDDEADEDDDDLLDNDDDNVDNSDDNVENDDDSKIKSVLILKKGRRLIVESDDEELEKSVDVSMTTVTQVLPDSDDDDEDSCEKLTSMTPDRCGGVSGRSFESTPLRRSDVIDMDLCLSPLPPCSLPETPKSMYSAVGTHQASNLSLYSSVSSEIPPYQPRSTQQQRSYEEDKEEDEEVEMFGTMQSQLSNGTVTKFTDTDDSLLRPAMLSTLLGDEVDGGGINIGQTQNMNDLVMLCSGKFDNAQVGHDCESDDEGDGDSQLFKSGKGNKTTLDEFVGLCSGRFTSSPAFGVRDDTEDPDDEDRDEQNEDLEASGLNNDEDLDENEEDRADSSLLRLRDDDSNDGDDLVDSDDDGDHINENGNNLAGHPKSRTTRDFFEDEAELSGSELGESDDEDLPAEEDYMEAEEGDLADDVASDEEDLRDQVGRVHYKTMVDEDKRRLRLYQEAFLQDGDLYNESGGRQRKFRWSNLNNDDSDDDDGLRKLSKSDDDDEDNEEDDATWRMQRYEREKWLSENGGLLTEDGDHQDGNQLFETNSMVKLSKVSLKKQGSLVSKTPAPDEQLTTDVIPSPKIVSKFNQYRRGSFLSRSPHALLRLAGGLTKKDSSELNPNGPKHSRNFVFAVISPDEKEKVKKRPSSSSNGSKSGPAPKRIKVDRTLSAEDMKKTNSIFGFM